MFVCLWYEYDYVYFLLYMCDGGYVGEKLVLGFLIFRSYFFGVIIWIFENIYIWVIDWNGSEWKILKFFCWFFIYLEKLIFFGN